MIRRSFVKNCRRHLCAAFSAAAVVYSLHNGASQSLNTILRCSAIAILLYGIVWAIDRIIGSLSPIIVDISTHAGLDRGDPYSYRLQVNNSVIKFSIDSDETVYKMQFDDGVVFRPDGKEFCYLKVGSNRLVKCDPELAYRLVRKIQSGGSSVPIKGLSYQA